jgi:hypothetical protein
MSSLRNVEVNGSGLDNPKGCKNLWNILTYAKLWVFEILIAFTMEELLSRNQTLVFQKKKNDLDSIRAFTWTILSASDPSGRAV